MLLVVLFSVYFFLRFAPAAGSQSNEDSLTNTTVSGYSNWTESTYFPNPRAEQEATDIWRAEKLSGTWQGQCVIAFRSFLNLPDDHPVVRGNAKDIKMNSDIPVVGGIYQTNESGAGHIGVVLIVTETQIYVTDSNIPLGSEIASTRWLDINDSRVLGFNDLVRW